MHNIGSFILGRFILSVALVTALILGISTVRVIAGNWALQQEIATLQSEVELLQAQNERLSYDIEYYKTDEYLEQAARQKLNLKAAGENVTIVGDTDQERATRPELAIERSAPPRKSNWQSWMDFLSGR